MPATRSGLSATSSWRIQYLSVADLPTMQPLRFHTTDYTGNKGSWQQYFKLLLTVIPIISHNIELQWSGRDMVKIRLRRVGAKKKPSYRLVAADSRAPRNGAFLDIIGHFNPLTDPETIVIDEEKTLHWLNHGAQPTATAARLISKAGIMEKFNKIKEKT